MKSLKFLPLLVVFFLVMAFTVPVFGQRDIPENNLSYPVLITLGNGSLASGFYLTDGTYFYLVTARHVLFDETKMETEPLLRSNSAILLSYPSDQNDQGKYKLRLDLETLKKNGLIRYSKTHDVAVVRLASIKNTEGHKAKIQYLDPVKVEEQSRERSGIATLKMISSTKNFDQVLEANEVFLFGYPNSLGLKEIPQIDYTRPLLRKGIVAGKNAVNKTIIIDCPTYYGNSGGLVVEVDRDSTVTTFLAIGIVSQFIPFVEEWVNTKSGYSNRQISNSGYSVIEPIDAVLEILQGW